MQHRDNVLRNRIWDVVSLCREFAANWRLIEDSETLVPPLSEDRDLGIMLYDMDFDKDLKKPDAMFYRAKMEQGVIVVPDKDSEEVMR